MKQILLASLAVLVLLGGAATLAMTATAHTAPTTPSLRSEVAPLVTAMRSCAVAIHRGDKVSLSDVAALDVLIGIETQACVVRAASFKATGGDARLVAIRQIGQRALRAATNLIGDQMDTDVYDRQPPSDTVTAHLTQYALQAVVDERAFVTEAGRFVRAVAQALHLPAPAL